MATRNQHKLEEIRAILSLPSLELLDLGVFPGVPPVVEDGETFEINAIKKAVATSLSTGLWSLADDSGLEVCALDGAPGVFSARYAGEPANYAANNARLLNEMERIVDRRARFRCVVALSTPKGVTRTVEGACEGCIVRVARGQEGFGYDPLFVPDGYSATFAELPADIKNGISHRAAALRKAEQAWAGLLAFGSDSHFGRNRLKAELQTPRNRTETTFGVPASAGLHAHRRPK